MIYIIILFLLLVGYYTITYGINIWISEKNKLGGTAVMTLSVLAVVITISFLLIRF